MVGYEVCDEYSICNEETRRDIGWKGENFKQTGHRQTFSQVPSTFHKPPLLAQTNISSSQESPHIQIEISNFCTLYVCMYGKVPGMLRPRMAKLKFLKFAI